MIKLIASDIDGTLLPEGTAQINPEIFKAVQGRLGRYPNKALVPPRADWGADDRGNPVGGCVTDEGKSNAHEGSAA